VEEHVGRRFMDVTRWMETEEQIAIKQCRQELSAKNKERWSLEIQIMKRLDHENVVAAREVPEALQKLATNDLPLLAMEYCQGGDLRKYLNLLENCCGMREGGILILLRDISSALTYLHKKRIIHRDLKPENIVLQQGEKRRHNGKGFVENQEGRLCECVRVGRCVPVCPSFAPPWSSWNRISVPCFLSRRHSKLKHKHDDDIVVYEDLSGEVHFSKHLPQPNNLNKFLVGKLEQWLQLMLRWSPQDRGKDGTERDKKLLVHVLNMITAETLTYPVQTGEGVSSLQQRIACDTGIPPANQELLLEAGLAMEGHNEAAQCAVDFTMIDGSRTDVPLVFLFDRTNHIYEPQFSPRLLPENVCFVQTNPKRVLTYGPLRRTYGQAWHTIRSLKDDWQRLQKGQKAAIMSLLRHNGCLSKQKNEMVSMHQRLKATLEFFSASLQIDMDKYKEQKATGIASEKLLSVWNDMEQTAQQCGQTEEVNKLEEEMMKLQTDIVDLQRQPWRSGDALETLEVKSMELFRKLREKPRDQRSPGDCQEVVRLVVQAIQFYEKKLRDFYTHLSKTVLCRQRVMELLPQVEGVVLRMTRCEQELRSLQERRQRELWNLLKVACSKVRSPVSGSPDAARTPSSHQFLTHRPCVCVCMHVSSNKHVCVCVCVSEESLVVIKESRTFENLMQSLMQETFQEAEQDMQVHTHTDTHAQSYQIYIYY
uniref:IkappaB kinase n=1 Tax=Denticeps clupeoides TaxID=299321 RepID=A0AAY4CAS8_9TELE